MSLLLDALKEAEHSKRRTQGTGDPGRDSASTQESTSQHRPLSLAEELPPTAPAAPASAALAAPDPRFAQVAKLRVLPAATASGAGRRLYGLVALLGAVILLLAGGYFYLTRSINAAPMVPAVEPVTAPTVAALPPTTHALPPATLTPHEPAPATREIRPARRQQANPAAIAASPAEKPIVVVASTAGSPLQAAYAALQTGDLMRAKALYQQVLAAEPNQPDAHLGLGVIAQSQQDRETAINQFRAVLTVVPDQPRAWAGLSELVGDGELPLMESKLRGLLATRPEAALHFALGNNLMRQSRWPEAQEEFFAASTAAPQNAEYSVNLAVALDRMGKRDAAMVNYRMALQLAAGRPVQFDVAAVRSRLAALSPGAP